MDNSVSKALEPQERKKICDIIRYQIDKRELNNFLEIKKLKIMLDLFELYGKEFDRDLPINEIKRSLHIRLFNNNSKKSIVVLKKCVS